MRFAENLVILSEVRGSCLSNKLGMAAIENALGSVGSFRVHAYLAGKLGAINAATA